MGRLKKILVVQIVGYKNTGKTTVIEHAIKFLKQKGYKVGVIKHHGHGGCPDTIDSPNTDTYRYQDAGAFITSVEGDGVFQLRVKDTKAIPLTTILKMYEPLSLDVILVEGYKQANYSKLITCRSKKELDELLTNTNNVIGIVENFTDHLKLTTNLPVFQLSNAREYVSFIEDVIKRS